MQKTLSVNAIENGTVIDHIPAGQGILILRLLKLANHQNRMTIGLNLKSGARGLKDLIKIEGRYLSVQQANYTALFAEQATINKIENFVVIEKYKVEPPDQIKSLLICPNPNCISNKENIESQFTLQQTIPYQLRCHYCEKVFSRQEIKEYAK